MSTNEKMYRIGESALLRLLASEHELIALDNGGVDNWDFRYDSIRYYLDDYVEELVKKGVAGGDPDDFWFDDIAQYELETRWDEDGEPIVR